jgi:hypothetical protein
MLYQIGRFSIGLVIRGLIFFSLGLSSRVRSSQLNTATDRGNSASAGQVVSHVRKQDRDIKGC